MNSQELIERIQNSRDNTEFTSDELLSYIQHYLIPDKFPNYKKYVSDPVDPSRIVGRSRCFKCDYVVFEDGSVEFDMGKKYRWSDKIERQIEQDKKDDIALCKFMAESYKKMRNPLKGCGWVYRAAFWASRGLTREEISKKIEHNKSKVNGFIRKFLKHMENVAKGIRDDTR